MGYSALDSGLAVSPRGLGSLAAMMVVGILVNYVDARILLGLGITGFRLLDLSVEPHQSRRLDGLGGRAQHPERICGRLYLCSADDHGHGPVAGKQEIGNAAGVFTT